MRQDDQIVIEGLQEAISHIKSMRCDVEQLLGEKADADVSYLQKVITQKNAEIAHLQDVIDVQREEMEMLRFKARELDTVLQNCECIVNDALAAGGE
jgi:small-conductance mechanosensitive channel